MVSWQRSNGGMYAITLLGLRPENPAQASPEIKEPRAARSGKEIFTLRNKAEGKEC
jgi:hypothetical protein